MNVLFYAKNHENLRDLQTWRHTELLVCCPDEVIDFFEYKGYNGIPDSVYYDLDMKFDHVIGNPPYLKNVHLKFLLKALNMSESVYLIHPAGWLFRNTLSVEREVKSALKNRVKRLTIFNGNIVFDNAEFAGPLVRTEAVKNHEGPIEVVSEITGNTYYINDLSEFPSGFWEPTVNHIELVNLFKTLSSNSLVSLKEKRSNRPFVGCPRVVGHGKTKEPGKYTTDDFMIFFYRNSKITESKSDDTVFAVESKSETKSLVSYLKTKFARFGLSINKISQDLYVDRYLSNVPLPPLDRVWTDQNLAEYYSLTPAQVTYIDEFIPDYY
jgi:hypothetical protein